MADLVRRFWSKVSRVGECWEWTGAVNKGGYGVLYPDGKAKGRKLAHRVSWEMERGPIPVGLYICHHCDNPPCVRPEHLFVGTPADNMIDMDAKGRRVPPCNKGVKNPRAKLNQEQVAEIRRLYMVGRYKPKQKDAPYTSKRLAGMFGVAASTIRLVTCGRNWT